MNIMGTTSIRVRYGAKHRKHFGAAATTRSTSHTCAIPRIGLRNVWKNGPENGGVDENLNEKPS
jgi:hypothetical protein